MVTDCKKLVESYLGWLRDKIRVADIQGVCEITTPFLDRHNDRLQIYVECRGDRVRLSDDGYIIGDLESCGCALLQAMLSVNDMFMTARQRVAYLFVEDVTHYLRESEVRFSPNVEFTGSSGFTHKYDFLIPPSRTEPERILRAINNPSRDSATSMIFSWTDTKDVRPAKSKAYVILNDAERGPSSDVLHAFSHYGIITVLWSQRDRYKMQLAT